jgi:hypothetical protein
VISINIGPSTNCKNSNGIISANLTTLNGYWPLDFITSEEPHPIEKLCIKSKIEKCTAVYFAATSNSIALI